MVQMLDLAADDYRLAEPIVDWNVPAQVQGIQGDLVELIASIKSDPALRDRRSQGKTATTLAIQMDSKAAKWLYEMLGALGRSMGWLPQQ